MDNFTERRDYIRVHDEFNVRVAKKKKKEKYQELEIDIAKSINISASGILLSIKTVIEMGDIIRVTFLKPNSFDFFEGFAKVMRIEDNSNDSGPSYSIGLNFFDLSEFDKKKLNYYITLVQE